MAVRHTRHRSKAESVGIQNENIFTAKGWARYATKELLRTSTAIDNVCHAVVACKRCYSHGSISDEIRDIGLTIAVLERSLFAYADRVRIHTDSRAVKSGAPPVIHSGVAEQPPPVNAPGDQTVAARKIDRKVEERSPALSSSTSKSSSLRGSSSDLLSLFNPPESDRSKPSSVEDIQQLDRRIFTSSSLVSSPSSSKSDVEATPSSPSGTQRRSDQLRKMPWKHYGGIVSLLGLMYKNLYSLRLTLHMLVRWNSFRSFVFYSKAISAGCAAAGFSGIFLCEFLLRLFPKLRNVLGVASILSVAATPMGVLISLFSPIFCSFILYRRLLALKLRRLRILHREMLILFRLWCSAVSVIDEMQVPSAGIPISRWMLDLVAPPDVPVSMINYRVALLYRAINVLYASFSVWHSLSSCRWFGAPIAMLSSVYFAMRPNIAASMARELLTSSDLRVIKTDWSQIDDWMSKKLSSASLHLPFRTVCDERFVQFDGPTGLKHQVRVVLNRQGTIIGDRSANKIQFGSDIPPIALVIRSGSWVMNMVAADIGYLAKWAAITGAPIVTANFILHADHTYPEAVAESFALYKWIVLGGLGFVPTRIVLVGDGAGGALAASICLQAELHRVKRPDQLILCYPVLSVRLGAMTPSRCAFFNDLIVPLSVLVQSRSVYLPFSSESDLDLCASPMSAPQRLLSGFPPTCIMSGGVDPMLDESIDFVHKLSAAGVFCQLKIFPTLVHGFLGFVVLVPSASAAVELAGQWIRAGLCVKTPNPPSVLLP